MRIIGGLLGVVLALSACGGDPFTSAVPPTTTGSRASFEPSTTSVPPTSAPSTGASTPSTTSVLESIPMSAVPTGASLPDGMTTADLPEDPGDRLDLMTDWLDDQFPDRTSGHAYFRVDGVYNLSFNLNLADEGDARALCPFYLELASLYLPDSAQSVSLYGWVIDETGRFGEAEWDRLSC